MHLFQPPPQCPQGLRLEAPPLAPSEPSTEEKVTLWEERVKLFSESTKAYEQCDTLEEEYEIALRATKSTLFESLRAEHQERLHGQLAQIARRLDDARAKYQTLRGKLLDTSSWPVSPPPTVHQDHEPHVELVNDVVELNRLIVMIKGIVTDKIMQPNPNMPTQQEIDEYREQLVAFGITDEIMQPDPNMPTQQEIDEYREQLVAFEDQVTSMRNEVAQFKLDRAVNMAHIVGSNDYERRERDTLMHAKIAEMQQLKIERDEEMCKWNKSKRKMLQLEEHLQAHISTQKTTSAVLDTLRTALKAYSMRPPSPPMSPTPVSASYLLETLRWPILNALRDPSSEMRLIFEQMRKNVEKLIEEKNKKLFEEVERKSRETLHVLRQLRSHIEKDQNQGNVQAHQSQPQLQ
ncbi:hypothetical protein HYPSUDRAFT_67058 [Hypholoma sublateritium FD-334 SS-4]|uniref:Uncharacterized protein n=1 Tax=Hypholoma sublateritium (strain FD-334 SS-4) TaxID=945553 RepID=A0A0D2NU05_HYPSF|nr:hypothetical protein HYPSUDRAFT_67058 [Hypholoma sublateritium FD-334 SS-4]